MSNQQTRHILKISDLTPAEFRQLVDIAIDMKQHEEKYYDTCKGKSLIAIYQKPSLRTHVSQEAAMTKLGGHCITYMIDAMAPFGKKESIEDTSKVLSNMVNVISARLNSKEEMHELAHHASVPCINSLDNWAHPYQMVCDFMTIKEKFGSFDGLTLTYSGDCENNVTYDLMRACSMLGMTMHVCCPDDKEFKPVQEVIDECNEICKSTGGKIVIMHDSKEACKNVDIVYCDSWMSYHISQAERAERLAKLMPFQINSTNFPLAKQTAIFMNCLPANRKEEQTSEIIDGPQSVIYQEAGNRMWSAMSMLKFCIDGFQFKPVK